MTGNKFTAFKTEGKGDYYRKKAEYPDLTNDQQAFFIRANVKVLKHGYDF